MRLVIRVYHVLILCPLELLIIHYNILGITPLLLLQLLDSQCITGVLIPFVMSVDFWLDIRELFLEIHIAPDVKLVLVAVEVRGEHLELDFFVVDEVDFSLVGLVGRGLR